MIFTDVKKFEDEADVVVIGSGPAGAVFTKEVAQRGFSVVLVEMGDYVKADDLPSERSERALAAFSKVYRNKGAVGTIGRPGYPSMLLPLGVGLGGGSIINCGTCLRLPENVLSEWKKFGIEINYDELVPIFEDIERELSITPAERELLGMHGSLILGAAERMGLSCGVLKRNVRGCKGCGQCAAICPENAKLAMHLTYIPKASEYGARIYTRSKATKILVENGRAAGVEGEVIDGDRKTGNFRVRGKVVAIACGAIDTPLLLLKNRLCNFSGQVGKNLSVHPALRVSGFFDEKIEQWRGIVQGYYIDEFAGQGIMMQGLSTPPLIAALVLPYTGMKHKKLILKYDHFASIGVMVTDTSRGRVFLFRDDIFINYNLARRDAQNLGRAAAEAAKILFEAGAKKAYPHIYGVDELEKPDDVKKLQRMRVKPSYLELSSFHPLGTCRMGSNPRRSVVNPDLESHDVKNLFIIDGSVFPTPIGVNPQETIMAFSARAAKYICENIL